MNKKNRMGRGLLVLSLGLAVLAGCATAPEPAPPPKPRSVLLAPTRFDERLANRLEAGAQAVHRLIGQVLWEQDVQVGTLPLTDFAGLWDAAREGVPALAGAAQDPDARYDATVGAMVGALRTRGARFDALVIPYLTVRPGAVNGHSVMWDGVTRRLPLETRHRADVLLPVRRGIATPCTSLRVIAYDAAGHRLFERVGGLEVANRLSLDGGTGTWGERDDLFQDPKALRQGVQVALGPFLRN
jgi:hypothetical protein